jgi:hypothetical protein
MTNDKQLKKTFISATQSILPQSIQSWSKTSRNREKKIAVTAINRGDEHRKKKYFSAPKTNTRNIFVSFFIDEISFVSISARSRVWGKVWGE